jgi:hypothetical protein
MAREKIYITYNAGCGIWEIETFNETIDWHHNEFQGTKMECKKEASKQMESGQPHYQNAEYESIFDY